MESKKRRNLLNLKTIQRGANSTSKTEANTSLVIKNEMNKSTPRSNKGRFKDEPNIN